MGNYLESLWFDFSVSLLALSHGQCFLKLKLK